MGPMTAVEILASKTAITEMMIRLRVTFTPRERAVLSSSASRLHCPSTKMEAMRPITTYKSRVWKSPQVFMVILALTMLAMPE